MTKFKVGDRVVCLDPGYEEEYGKIGIVTFADESLYGVRVEEGLSHLYYPHEVKPVEPSIPAAIDQYTAACQAFEAAKLALEKAKAAVEDARNDLRDALDGEA